MVKYQTHAYFQLRQIALQYRPKLTDSWLFSTFHAMIRKTINVIMKNLFKKILVFCAIIAVVSSVTSLISPQSAFADPGGKNCRYLVPGSNIVSWDCGTNFTSDTQPTEDDIKYGIWIVVANIISDITAVIAYLALGYVIYGGYLYMSSSGDPTKVTSGKRTLSHAFIGLGIVLSANVIMGAIRFALVGGSGDIGSCSVDQECVTPADLIQNLLQWAIGIAGLVSVVFIVLGGVSYMSSSGDSGKIKKAKETILYALIGLVIVALSEMIVAFVFNTITDANATDANDTALTNAPIIAKELHETKPL